ncbi:MAG: hypothetical protein OXG41_06065 [Acidimicrobiaceae bacterium]|nr:hypothetical protein [Acidimicrobiaceae bacterium]
MKSFPRCSWIAVLAVIVLAAAACGGDEPVPATQDSAAVSEMADMAEMAGDGSHRGHDHGTAHELAAGVPVPSIAIEIAADPVEGWNLRIHTTDFLIVPENASTTHVDGEGHMHLYVDGEKLSRIYGEWHHITGLQPGSHDVRVELSSNNHSALSIDGEIIDATAKIFQDRRTNLSLVRDDPAEAIEPHPSVSVRLVKDPAGGWSLHAVPSNFRLAPENASTGHIDGEGHMRLFVDGEQVARLYETWFQMPPLQAGTHEIKVDLRTNDHAPLTVNGLPVETAITLEVSEAEATMPTSHDHTTSDGHDHSHDHDHGSAGAPTRYDADVADATQTIMVSAVGGAPEGGVQRVQVDIGSVVALMVTSDVAEEVHVHGYDILRAVSDGHPAHFAFNAEIPGVFEVEFEGSGRLLLQLQIS